MKTKIYIPILLMLMLSGCSIPALLNPDSYGKKWENTFLFFDPENLENIYVSKYGIFEGTGLQQNDTDYLVKWESIPGGFQITITSFFHDVFAVDFSGYKVAPGQEEIPWEINGRTFTLKMDEVSPPENGFYRIALSEDLTK